MCLFEPAFRLPLVSKTQEIDTHFEGFQLVVMIAQLRDVLPARQSTEMAEEYQHNGGAVRKYLLQSNAFAVEIGGCEIRGVFSDLQCLSLSWLFCVHNTQKAALRLMTHRNE